HLLRQRRFRMIERRRRLLPHLLPSGEVLLERLGAWRRRCHALAFEGEAAAAAGEVRILAAHLVEQILGFFEVAGVFLAQPGEIGAALCTAAASPFARAARFARRALRTGLAARLAVLAAQFFHFAARGSHAVAQLLSTGELFGGLPRIGILEP